MLFRSFYKVSEKLYQQSGAAQGQGFDPNNMGGQGPAGGNGQDYYDADYTVVDDDK